MKQFIKHRILYWIIIIIGLAYIASLSEKITHHKYTEQRLRSAIQTLLEKLKENYDINH